MLLLASMIAYNVFGQMYQRLYNERLYFALEYGYWEVLTECAACLVSPPFAPLLSRPLL